jgi:DNA-binding MarR family transcriptional regulator
MRASASSSRMQGVLSDPTNINPIGHDFIKSLIGARLEVFACRADAVAPVEVQGFDHIYRVTNNNLRIAMKHSEDFAIWASDQEIHLLDSTEKFALLETWFSNEADLYLEDTSGVGPTAWQVFDRLAEKGGNMSPSEYADFDFESNQAMRPHIRMLEEANLVESAIDETDDRRKTISITARGWIVKYKRKNSAKTSCG